MQQVITTRAITDWVDRKNDLELNTQARDLRHLPTGTIRLCQTYDFKGRCWSEHWKLYIQRLADSGEGATVGWGCSWLCWSLKLLISPPFVWGKPRNVVPPSGRKRESQERVSPQASSIVAEPLVSPGVIGKVRKKGRHHSPESKALTWSLLHSDSGPTLRAGGLFLLGLISSHHEELRGNIDFLPLRVG